MKQLVRSLILLLIVVGLGAGTSDVSAQAEPGTPPSAEELAKQREKEDRIREYLRKKEERRAMREMRQEEKTLQRAEKKSEPAERRASDLPRSLARAQDIVRRSALGQDPSVQLYLDQIDRQEASPQELAAFGNFLSESGMGRVAIEYYGVALALEQDDPILWLNAGTLHRQNGDLGAAMAAYSRTLGLDQNNAWAHYNIGAILDAQGKYEDAIEAYTVALTIDPSLGDPTVNPQATNNGRLLAVKLGLYRQQAGSLGLPLVPIPGRDVPVDEPAVDDDEN